MIPEMAPEGPTTDEAVPATAERSDAAVVGERPLRRFIRRFRRERLAVVALIVLALFVAASALAPVLAPYDPNAQNLANLLAPPGSEGHLLGTDHLGRDIVSRLLYGGQVSLLAAVQAVAVGAALGVVPGLLAGYLGGRTDWLIMRVTDTMMSFPPLILAMTVIAALGPGLVNAMIAIGILFAPRFLRMARSAVLAVREEVFVEAARSMGIPRWQIMSRHIVPHTVAPLTVTVSVLASHAMLAEAALSFLGLGVQPPDASWGVLIAIGYQNIFTAPDMILWPGLCIAVVVLAFNLLGDGIRDSLGRETRHPVKE